ncbi:MAG: hypothetical protein HQL74_13200 [Magnetococcales bacterium]|nr:hypothetical protein [Magnetococcales bacterium]
MMCECNYDGPNPTFFTDDVVEARKPHLCCECHKTIKPGEYYMLSKGMWEGEFRTYKQCGVCLAIKDMVGCCVFGDLAEEIGETDWKDLVDHVGYDMAVFIQFHIFNDPNIPCQHCSDGELPDGSECQMCAGTGEWYYKMPHEPDQFFAIVKGGCQ